MVEWLCDCQCQCQWWTATYLCHLPWSYAVHQSLDCTSVILFRHEIPGTNRRQDTHSLSVGPVTVTVDSVVGAPLPASGFFEFARRTGWYIVGRTACWICWPTLYFRLYRSLRIESEGSDSENVLLFRERPLPQQTPWAHFYYVLRVRTQLHLHFTHAWSLISSWIILGLCFPYNLLYFCVNHCVCASYCEVNQIQKHKLRFVVVNNTFEIVTIWSVWERKTSSWRHDVKFARHMDGDVCLHRYGTF